MPQLTRAQARTDPATSERKVAPSGRQTKRLIGLFCEHAVTGKRAEYAVQRRCVCVARPALAGRVSGRERRPAPLSHTPPGLRRTSSSAGTSN